MKETNLSVDIFFKKIIEDVNTEIENRINDPIIKSVLEGGKRLRPMLMLLCYHACNGKEKNNGNYKKALEGAVSIELAHNASLVHDDIIDRDTERRGKPSLYVRNGVDTALLIGHKMIAAGFDIALSHGPDIAKVYVDTWNKALSGEILEVKMNNNGKEEYSKENLLKMYYNIIDQKTASLFESACMSGALEAKASWDIAKTLGQYGREIGMAYQLADDLVDLENGEIEVLMTSLLDQNIYKTEDFKWLYNNGDTSSAINLTRKFSKTGTYQAKLIGTTKYSCTDSLSKTFVISDAPPPDFSINDTSQCLDGNDFTAGAGLNILNFSTLDHSLTKYSSIEAPDRLSFLKSNS